MVTSTIRKIYLIFAPIADRIDLHQQIMPAFRRRYLFFKNPINSNIGTFMAYSNTIGHYTFLYSFDNN